VYQETLQAQRRRAPARFPALMTATAQGKDGYEGWEPVWGATVFSLPQTMPDCPGVLTQVGGSPFDCAGLGSTDL